MKILLDTHVFLWAITADSRMAPAHRELFVSESNDLYFSVASIWELLIKSGIGKIRLPTPAAHYVRVQMDKNRITLLPVRMAHLGALESLPPLHRDPFDRMLIAQARAERMSILSVDEKMRQYGGEVL